MPQCKLSDCREQAVSGPWRKRYCEEHGERYLRRKKEYDARRRTFPDCASGLSPQCEGKVSEQRQVFGRVTCRPCAEAADALDREDYKRRSLENAESVHDLKEWIRSYAL